MRLLSDSIGERNQGAYRGLERATAYLARTLAQAGHAVDTLAFQVGQQWYYNLEVSVAGSSRAEESIVVGAHYDTAEGTPDADDNASGTARPRFGTPIITRWETSRTSLISNAWRGLRTGSCRSFST